MKEKELRRLLRSAPLPDEADARRRAWEVVASAYAEREPVAWPRRHARPLLVAAVGLAIVAGAVTPPGQAVLGSLRDAIGREKVVVGRKPSAPALVSLPAKGRLLVNSRRGPWVVHPDGSKRLLGPFGVASWSPHGWYVVAARPHEVAALEPGKTGAVHWSLARRGRIRGARWSPAPGDRVAYVSGGTLRVVIGNGEGDRALARPVAPVAPAWRPDPGHVLAFAEPDGRIRAIQSDTSMVLWTTQAGGEVPTQLDWSPDGSQLVAVGPSTLRVLDRDGRLLRQISSRFGAFVFAPNGHAFAVVRLLTGDRSAVDVMHGLRLRRIFSGPGRFGDLAWSPDGRWMLVTWPSADQWLFIRAAGTRKLVAYSDITRQFGGGKFPRLGGWCCTPS